MKSLSLVLLAICLIFSSPAMATKQERSIVKVNTVYVAQFCENENRAVYIDIIKEIAKRERLTLSIQFNPPVRSIKEFMRGNADVFMPGLDSVFNPTQMPIRTKSYFGIIHNQIFTIKGKPFLKKLSDLEGKRVGIIHGYPYSIKLTRNPKIIIDTAKDYESNIKKLMSGRIDAFVGTGELTVAEFKRLNLHNQMQTDNTSRTIIQEIYFAFRDTDRGRSLRAAFETHLSAMIEEGEVNRIRRKYGFNNLGEF